MSRLDDVIDEASARCTERVRKLPLILSNCIQRLFLGEILAPVKHLHGPFCAHHSNFGLERHSVSQTRKFTKWDALNSTHSTQYSGNSTHCTHSISESNTRDLESLAVPAQVKLITQIFRNSHASPASLQACTCGRLTMGLTSETGAYRWPCQIDIPPQMLRSHDIVCSSCVVACAVRGCAEDFVLESLTVMLNTHLSGTSPNTALTYRMQSG